MKISEIIMNSPVSSEFNFEKDVEVTGLTYDSRKVKPGNIFFAIKGLKDDGNKFVNNALNNGARSFSRKKILKLTKQRKFRNKLENIRKLMAVMSGVFYFRNLHPNKVNRSYRHKRKNNNFISDHNHF